MRELYTTLGLLLACSSSSSPSTKSCVPPCPAKQVCVAGECIPGGTTPSETLQYFTTALQSNNLEEAASYFSLHRQGLAREALSSQNLVERATQLEQAPKEEGVNTGGYREIHFQIGEEIYTITFHCLEHGPCKIISL